jgi:hypothetical protein
MVAGRGDGPNAFILHRTIPAPDGMEIALAAAYVGIPSKVLRNGHHSKRHAINISNKINRLGFQRHGTAIA